MATTPIIKTASGATLGPGGVLNGGPVVVPNATPAPTTGPNTPTYSSSNAGFTQVTPSGTITGPGAVPSATTPTSALPPALTTPAGGAAPINSATPNNPDAGYSQAESNLTPSAPESEDSFFNDLYEKMAPVIQSINDTETSAETAAYAAGTQDEVSLNETLGDRGLSGGSGAAGAQGQAQLSIASNIAAAKQAQSTALSTALTYLTGQAHTEFTDAQTRNDTMSANYVASMQANALATVKGIAESGITSGSDLQSKNPQAYAALLQYYNGDPNALNSALVMNQPVNNIKQSWTQGSTYFQLVTDPITGAPKVQQIDTGVNIPVGWTSNKVSTNTLLMQDPNNPSNSIIYTTDPISGQVTVSGSGTGQSLAAQYNSQNAGGSTTSTTTSPNGSGYISAATSTAGITDPTLPFADAVIGANGVGIGALVAGVQNAEGGSPTGVVNNPGNVKYVAGMAGATDSGVKASDGGTFASFATPQDGQNAIGTTLNNIATKLGSGATVQDVLDTYANLSNGSSGSGDQGPVGTNGLPIAQYGALANVAGFDPGSTTDAQITDSMAYNYLTEYLNGQTPSASSLGISTRTGSGAQFDKAAQRAKTLYNQATGQNLPNQTELTANLGFINSNNSLLNSLAVQEGTISANSDLLQANITADNINQNAPVINKVIDGISEAMGDPGVASYFAQNSTLSNELGSLLALKNASGTTVHDKLISADLISPDASAEQEAAVVNTLMKEAQNAHSAISVANAKLYQTTDPLGLDPQNPLSDPSTFAASVGLNLSAIQADYPNLTPQEIVSQYVNGQ